MSEQKNITKLLPSITAVWEKTKGDPTVRIAVLDGPVDLEHYALKEANITSLDSPVKKEVRSTHGTFVSSLIFANHNSGILGIAPNCSGLVKSIYREDENGKLLSSSQSDIEQGIRVALEQNADIINISGGEKLNDGDHIISSLANALELCEKKGVLVIAATGNEGGNSIHVPASYPTVLAVGSIKSDGKPSDFSNWSSVLSEQGLVAPGENIIGAVPSKKNQKAIARGTSFSTALVSGVAGLLASLQRQQGLKKDLLAIRQILLSSVIPCAVNEKINCDRIMNGRLNISGIMKMMQKSASTATKSNKFLILNTINMENEPEVTPLAATNDQPSEVTAQAAPATVEETAVTPQAVEASVNPSEVETSSCGCDTGVTPSQASGSYNPALNPGGYPTFKNAQLINAIGQPSYDFGTRNNLDTFTALMRQWYENLPQVEIPNKPSEPGSLAKELTDSPHDQKSLAAFLLYQEASSYPNIFLTSQLIWLLNMNASPIYSISPKLATFSDPIYLTMAQFLADNVGIDYIMYSKYLQDIESGKVKPGDKLPKGLFTEKEDKNQEDVMRMVLPGYVSGKSKLINGNYVTTVTPVAYGLKDWTLKALLESMGIKDPELRKQLISILNRLYVTTLNKGQSPDDRALNYSLYNILELSDIVKKATENKLQLSGYKVTPSKVSRQNSISREVQLTFFDPADTRKASTTYSMQVDISGVTPIMVGEIQEWYAPVSVAIA
ncbi:S8 family serine peptidase [Kordia sp.]|uniref:S8 family serine peptidase n=1 Tax=Kordia sp. TaxID=1965332 RepID=UPI003D6BFF10